MPAGFATERQHSLSAGSNGVAGTFPLKESNGRDDYEALLRKSSETNNILPNQSVRAFYSFSIKQKLK